MKLLNKSVVGISMAVFGVHFAFMIASLSVCYFLKSLYCKFVGAKSFEVNPFSHVNPQVYQTPKDVLALDGYRIDNYDFLTEDNCTLTCWRVVNLNSPVTGSYPVVLQHGLLDCSISWFLQKDRSHSLPYVLSSMGFDVWVGNNRGTKFSSQEQDTQGYWDYSFDQLAKFDVPAIINGIVQQTNSQKVIYIGHSQGSSQFLAHLADYNEQVSSKIQCFVALGPVISLKDVKNHPALNIASRFPALQMFSWLGFKTILHIPAWMSRCVGVLIYNTGIYSRAFLYIVNGLCGFPTNNKIDMDGFGVMIAHQPGGASINNVMHWIQLSQSDQFNKFDHGVQLNRQMYGCDTPPAYNFDQLRQYTFNKYIFKGGKDAVISDGDFSLLLSKLDPASTFTYDLPDYAHLDYVWGTCAKELLYDNIANILVQQSQ